VTTAQAVVDTHIHFWDTDGFDYPWLEGFTELNRPLVPADRDVGDQWTGWLQDIKAMAHLDNVRCKLSGLTGSPDDDQPDRQPPAAHA
jgi:predicted TIM-barrel fold metal-dependent hydrolase